jgi:hypothetical protein
MMIENSSRAVVDSPLQHRKKVHCIPNIQGAKGAILALGLFALLTSPGVSQINAPSNHRDRDGNTMSPPEVDQIIRAVIRDDIEPPSNDYSVYDYGAEVARSLNQTSASSLIIESLRSLPASLAESFLEGVLDRVSILNLQDILFVALPQVSEITSAATIVQFLIERSAMARPALAMRLLSDIQRTREPHVQNVYAYAILTTLGDRKPVDLTDPVVRQQDAQIQKALEAVPRDKLTDYARGLLERCMRQGPR